MSQAIKWKEEYTLHVEILSFAKSLRAIKLSSSGALLPLSMSILRLFRKLRSLRHKVRDCSAFPFPVKSKRSFGHPGNSFQSIAWLRNPRVERSLLSWSCMWEEQQQPHLCQGPRIFLSWWRRALSSMSHIGGSTRSHSL